MNTTHYALKEEESVGEKELGLSRRQRADMQTELQRCNKLSARYGLTLSESEMRELTQCRAKALRDTGRVEFGGGILPKLIYAFCDSPYIQKEDYESTLAELQDAFYYFKGEAMERFTDDELIEYMQKVFNGAAEGSVDYLTGSSLEELCRMARDGWTPLN